MLPPMPKVEQLERPGADVTMFDDDHRQLIALFNELQAAVEDGRARTTLRVVLLGLGSYAENHFAAEEKVMGETGYSQLQAHVAEHREFAARVQGFAQAIEIGDTGVTLEVVSYLGNWLEHHLGITDHAFIAHLNGKTVQ